MTPLLASSRPFLPLFVHVLGAMFLFGAVLAALITAAARRAAPTLTALLVAVPAFIVMRGGAQWIYSKEGWSGHNDPTWLGVGFGVSDSGVIVLLAAIAAAYWWKRAGRPLGGHISTALCGVYLVMLAIAWLAMSGKWG